MPIIMKKILIPLLIATLILSLSACGSIGSDPFTDGQSDSVSANNANDPNNPTVSINGHTVVLDYESYHKDMHFKENIPDIEKASYGQVCNLFYHPEGEEEFSIRICYFEGKSIEETMDGTDYALTTKTVNGLDYSYFEFQEGSGTPGHCYLYTFDGTTYSINFLSNYDMTSLESAFMSTVYFEKE